LVCVRMFVSRVHPLPCWRRVGPWMLQATQVPVARPAGPRDVNHAGV
jgi:hypothetical protein